MTYAASNNYHDADNNYRDQLSGAVSYQLFNRETMSFVDLDFTPAIEKYDIGTHEYRFSLPSASVLGNEAILRAVFHKPSDTLTTKEPAFGFKQRNYFDPSKPSGFQNGTLITDAFVLTDEDDYTDSHSTTPFIADDASYAYSANDGVGIVLVLKLEVNAHGTTGPIGDQGLRTLPEAAALNNYIKVGVTNAAGRTAYPKITNAALDYTPGWKTANPPDDNAADILKLYLDPAVNIRSIQSTGSNGSIQVFLGDGDDKGWGYQGDSNDVLPNPVVDGGVFGAKEDITTLVDGKLGFVNYVNNDSGANLPENTIRDIRTPTP
jgi:hypothetical protein